MASPTAIPAEVELERLRRGLRDLTAVSLLHGLWEGRDVEHIADGLCGTVYRLLDLDIAAVRIGTTADAQTHCYPQGADGSELVRTASEAAQAGAGVPAGYVVHIQDLDGLPAIVVGRSARPGFPTNIDSVIFRAVSNEAEVAARASRRLADARAARRMLEAVIEQMPVGVVIAAVDGRTVARNAAFDRIVAPLARPAQPGGPVSLDDLAQAAQNLELRRSDDRPYPESEWPLTRSLGGLSITDDEVALAGPDGAVVTLSISSAPVLGPDGQVVAAVATVADVSARREADAVRDAFISMLSHELRTPTTAIYAGAQLLRRHRDSVGREQAGIVDDIAAEAERLERIVQNFLVLARVDRGAEVRGHEPVLLQRLVPKALLRETERWPDRTFLDRLSPDLPPVAADESAVELVLRNLVNNAAKYGGPGATVEVTGSVDGGMVRLEILDDGPGLTAAEADDVFSLFYRSPRLAASADGAGVGLYVVRSTVNALEGSTWARPRQGGGALFGFTLPIWPDLAQEPGDPVAATAAIRLPATGSVSRARVAPA